MPDAKSPTAYEKLHARIVSKPKKKTRKTKKPDPNPPGPPRKPIDPNQIYQFARRGCTHEEMAGFCGVSHDTILRRLKEPEFKLQYDAGWADRKEWLRLKQDDVAEAGNVQMLIFLGKNQLGQSDKVETQHTGPDGGPIILSQLSADELKVLLAMSLKLKSGSAKDAVLDVPKDEA